jgi:hypothetical protein
MENYQKQKNRFTLICCLIISSPLLLCFLGIFNTAYLNSNKRLLQTLEVPERGVRFVLFTSASGFGDTGWTVYELTDGQQITSEMKDARNRDGCLFWSYEEGGSNTSGAKLNIYQDRYLVFSRGGYNYTLYDLYQRELIVYTASPWHDFQASGYYKEDGKYVSPKDMDQAQNNWVRDNLHQKIEQIIQNQLPKNQSNQ